MATPPTMAPRMKLVSLAATWLPLFTAAIAIIFAVAAYFLLLVPNIRPLMAGGEYDFSAIKTQLDSDQAYVQTMKDALAGFSKLEPEKIDRAASIIPFDADIPGLLVQVDEIARANKMALQSIDSAIDEKNISQLGRKTVRVSLSVTGGDYEQFKLFLADMERSLRLFDVTTMTFSADGKVYGLVFKTYFIDRKVQPSFNK